MLEKIQEIVAEGLGVDASVCKKTNKETKEENFV